MVKQDTIVNINLGDSGGDRQMKYAEVQRVIRRHLDTANFAMAASISIQLADQFPTTLWPQLIAAESLYLHQQIEPAFRYVDLALEIDPGDLASLVVKSRLCVYAGDQAQAVRLIDSAIALAPTDSRLRSVKAELLVDTGDIEGARDNFLKSIELDRLNTDGLLGLAGLPGDNFSDELIKKVEFLIHSGLLSVDSQVHARFALAYAYDKKGNTDRHFEHLNAGNGLKNRTMAYDRNAASQEVQRTIEFFSEEFFSQRVGMGGNPANIIFVVGFPRCGSTLVEQILSSHPSVSAAGEIFALRHAIRDFQQSKNLAAVYPYWMAEQSGNSLNLIAADYLSKVQRFNLTTYMTDKLLENYMFIGVIHLLFPNAIIINVQRNAIDVGYSCYKRLFNLNSLPFTYNLTDLANKYRDYQEMIRHWNHVLPGRVHTVEYEKLVNGQEEVTRNLLEHCGLPWHDACLDFHRNVRTVQTSSNVQVRQPLYTDSIDLWKNYADHLGPLLDLVGDNK